MTTITIACYTYTGPPPPLLPVQSASKQIGSRFERSHAIIPISLRDYLEFFIFIRILQRSYNSSRYTRRLSIQRDSFLLLYTRRIKVNFDWFSIALSANAIWNIVIRHKRIKEIDEEKSDIVRRYPRPTPFTCQPGYFPRPTREARKVPSLAGDSIYTDRCKQRSRPTDNCII